MSSIVKDANGKYSVRYKIKGADGKWHDARKRGFARWHDAKAWDEARIRGEKVASGRVVLSVAELSEVYHKAVASDLKPSSVVSSSDCARLYIIPYLGNKKIDKLSVSDIIEWKGKINAVIGSRGVPLSYKYKAKVYSAFSAMMEFARRVYGLERNVVRDAGNFTNTEPKKPMSFWTESEFERFIAAVDDIEYRALFSFLYLTGCRKGEALALTWRDIDFDAHIAHITKSINRKGLPDGVHYQVTTPKNDSSYRDIVLPDQLVGLLLEWREFCGYFDDYTDDWFLFSKGEPLVEQTIRRRMNEYADKAGVKHIRVHDLRHSHASLLINHSPDKSSIMLVAARLGHSDVKQTLNTYSHLLPNEQIEMVGKIKTDIGATTPPPAPQSQRDQVVDELQAALYQHYDPTTGKFNIDDEELDAIITALRKK